MAIDDCKHTFEELANVRLPEYMRALREKLKDPIPMRHFSVKGEGPSTIAKNLGLSVQDGKLKGCYVLVEKGRPVYVGISQDVLSRLTNHVKGKTHNESTLAYKIAAGAPRHDMPRDEAMNDSDFQREFEKAKDQIKNMNVAFIEIENDLELHIFEAYCSMELNTSKLNSFRTH